MDQIYSLFLCHKIWKKFASSHFFLFFSPHTVAFCSYAVQGEQKMFNHSKIFVEQTTLDSYLKEIIEVNNLHRLKDRLSL